MQTTYTYELLEVSLIPYSYDAFCPDLQEKENSPLLDRHTGTDTRTDSQDNLSAVTDWGP